MRMCKRGLPVPGGYHTDSCWPNAQRSDLEALITVSAGAYPWAKAARRFVKTGAPAAFERMMAADLPSSAEQGRVLNPGLWPVRPETPPAYKPRRSRPLPLGLRAVVLLSWAVCLLAGLLMLSGRWG